MAPEMNAENNIFFMCKLRIVKDSISGKKNRFRVTESTHEMEKKWITQSPREGTRDGAPVYCFHTEGQRERESHSRACSIPPWQDFPELLCDNRFMGPNIEHKATLPIEQLYLTLWLRVLSFAHTIDTSLHLFYVLFQSHGVRTLPMKIFDRRNKISNVCNRLSN